MESTNLLFIFLTGLTTGGLTCLALQGGLLTSVIANSPSSRAESRDLTPSDAKHKTNKSHSRPDRESIQINSNSLTPILSFLTAKLLAHTVLGFFLGALGATISLSPITRGWLQIAIGIYLFGVAGNLLNLHPLFRYFIITPPKFLAKLVRNESKSNSIFAPALLGLMTIFIPCGTTQAMEVVAIGTGSPIYAATIMFAFVLGTSPTFLIFGFLIKQGATWFKKLFPAVASASLIGMSIYSINAGVGIMGSVYTIQNFIEAAKSNPTPSNNSILGKNSQTVTINVNNYGYSPSVINLKRGVPAKITLNTVDVESCSRAFTIPALRIEKLLPQTGTTVIEFTPEDLGTLAFSCSMGMYTGRFNIIN